MKTQLTILLTAIVLLTSCQKSETKPIPTKSDPGWGQVIFWQHQQYDMFTVTLSDKEQAQVAGTSISVPECNTEGSATFKLIEGDYTYSITSYKGKATSGYFTVVKDKCLPIEVVLK